MQTVWKRKTIAKGDDDGVSECDDSKINKDLQRMVNKLKSGNIPAEWRGKELLQENAGLRTKLETEKAEKDELLTAYRASEQLLQQLAEDKFGGNWNGEIIFSRMTMGKELTTGAFIRYDIYQNAKDKLEAAENLLESLAPGGSEYHNDLQRCVDYVKSKINALEDDVKDQIKRKHAAENQTTRIEAAEAVTRTQLGQQLGKLVKQLSQQDATIAGMREALERAKETIERLGDTASEYGVQDWVEKETKTIEQALAAAPETKTCSACAGTGYYDSADKKGNPIKCEACNGSGRLEIR
jgi:hypothetical protein